MVDKVLDIALAKRMAAAISIAFLAIHVAMIALFAHYGVVPMAYFNVFSIAFYLFTLYMIHKEWLREFAAFTYLEVVCHMTLAIYFTGWENGFQITIIGLSVLLYFAEYIGHSLQIRHVEALPLCVLGAIAYLAVFAVSQLHPAPYTLPEPVPFWLQIAWGVIVFAISITILQVFILATFSSEEALTTRLEHDHLTGLPNRTHMARYLNETMKSEGLSGYWAAMADIDDFKQINDTFGHNCGDEVLKSLADELREHADDLEVCRWGGEEFLLIGKVEGGLEEQRSKIDRLRRAIAERTLWHGEQRLAMTVTFGMAAYDDGDTVTEWINKADKKLYEGKAAGKNRVEA